MRVELCLLAVLLLTGCASQGPYFESDIPGLATWMSANYKVPLAKCGPGETAILTGKVTGKNTRINLNRQRSEYRITCRPTTQ